MHTTQSHNLAMCAMAGPLLVLSRTSTSSFAENCAYKQRHAHTGHIEPFWCVRLSKAPICDCFQGLPRKGNKSSSHATEGQYYNY